MSPQQSTSQKRPWLDIRNRHFFPPLSNYTLYKSLNRWSTSLALAGYRLIVLQPKRGYLITSCFYFLYFPCCFCHCYLALSHLALESPSPILVLYGERYGLIGLAPFLPFRGLVGLLVVGFCQTGLLGLFLFFSFLWTFIALCFCHYFLIFSFFPFCLLLGFFFFGYWAPFIKKRVSTLFTVVEYE